MGNNKKTDDEKQLQPFHTLLIAIVIIVAAILIGQAIKDAGETGDTGAPAEDQAEVMEGEEEQMDDERSEDEIQNGAAVNTNVMTLEDFSEREQAQQIINSTQGKRVNTVQYETIRGPVMRDAQNEHIVYFATGSQNKDPHFVGVYQYDTESNRWNRQFKHTYEAEGDQSAVQLKVIGRTSSHLVLLVDRVDREHEECDSYWLTGADEEGYSLVTLDLDAPLDGLQDYEITNRVRQQEEARVAECQE